MKRTLSIFALLAALWCLIPGAAHAQNVVCPTQPFGDSSNACASTAFVQANAQTKSLQQNFILVGNASNIATAVALGGDCTIVANGTITCTKTNGVSFAAIATSGSATDLIAGTVASARGGAGIITGALKGNGAGVVSQAACADLSNGSASCSTDATNATNIASGTLGAARLPSGLDKFVVSGPSTARTYTFPDANATVTRTIASGAKALATGAISSATCTSAQTDTATGTLTTDAVIASFNGDPTAVTGYVPLTTGMLTIIVYPTADTANFKVCNNTGSSITPGAVTINWRVVR